MCKDTEPRTLPEDSDSPKWFDEKKVIEIAFCEEFLTRHPMCCIHGRFFTADGPVPDDVVRMECYSSGLPLQTDRIHVANGTLFLDGRLEPAKEFCLNRLPVEYHPDAPEPKAWLQFVEELLYDEDIPTLQKYMGYCLLPPTKAHKRTKPSTPFYSLPSTRGRRSAALRPTTSVPKRPTPATRIWTQPTATASGWWRSCLPPAATSSK